MSRRPMCDQHLAVDFFPRSQERIMEHRISDEFGWCEVCGGNPDNGTLPTDCPGRLMWKWEKEEVQDGTADHIAARGGWETTSPLERHGRCG